MSAGSKLKTTTFWRKWDIAEIIAAIFERRLQKVRIGNVFSEVLNPFRGCPQGTVITWLSFLIVINNVVVRVSMEASHT